MSNSIQCLRMSDPLISQWCRGSDDDPSLVVMEDLVNLGGDVFYGEAASIIIDDPSLSFEEAWNRCWYIPTDGSNRTPLSDAADEATLWSDLDEEEKERFEGTREKLMEMREINLAIRKKKIEDRGEL